MTPDRKAILATAEAHRAAIEGARANDPASRPREYGGGSRQGWHVEVIQGAQQPPKPKTP
jgi:hypothetical protein